MINRNMYTMQDNIRSAQTRLNKAKDDLIETYWKKIEEIYSDLLRVKHGTMNLDAVIDKVYAMKAGVIKDEKR